MRRNAVPHAVPFKLAGGAAWVFHSIHFSEATGFRREHDHVHTKDSHRERDHGLLLEHTREGVQVGFCWEDDMGLPRRHQRQRAFILAEGGYCRLIVNGRHSGYENHWYSQGTYNVLSAREPCGDAFTGRAPDGLLDLRENLP